MIYQAPGNFYASAQKARRFGAIALQHQARLQPTSGTIMQAQAGIHRLRQLPGDRQTKAGTAGIAIA